MVTLLARPRSQDPAWNAKLSRFWEAPPPCSPERAGQVRGQEDAQASACSLGRGRLALVSAEKAGVCKVTSFPAFIKGPPQKGHPPFYLEIHIHLEAEEP